MSNLSHDKHFLLKFSLEVLVQALRFENLNGYVLSAVGASVPTEGLTKQENQGILIVRAITSDINHELINHLGARNTHKSPKEPLATLLLHLSWVLSISQSSTLVLDELGVPFCPPFCNDGDDGDSVAAGVFNQTPSCA